MASSTPSIGPKLRAGALYIILTAIASSKAIGSMISPFAEHTIGQFVPGHFPTGYTNNLIGKASMCTDFLTGVDASTFTLSPWSCTLSSLPINQDRIRGRRLQGIMNTYAYFTEYDDGNGNGYKIIYPLQLCPDRIVGDVMSPKEGIVHNATLQSIWTSLVGLSDSELYNYTETMLQNAFDSLNNVIKPALCKSANSGLKRMPSYLPSDVSGNWVFSIALVPGCLGVAFGALYVPIAKPGAVANLTGTQDALIIAAGTVFTSIYFLGVQKLHKAEVTNIVEAWILTVLSTAGQYIATLLQHAWQGTCIGLASLGAAIEQLRQNADEGPVVVGNVPNQAGVEMVPPNNPAAQSPNLPQVQLEAGCS
ncbi:MAG: hypothetical protein Q9195_006860 [Heterodermia aff. obscurata]